VDVGVEQGVLRRSSCAWATTSTTRFGDLLGSSARTGLWQAGVTAAAANATTFGAYVNSNSTTRQWSGTIGPMPLGTAIRVFGFLTYLTRGDQGVQRVGVDHPLFSPAS